MPDLEQRIVRKLETISAHDLQVLAEDIAQVRNRKRYFGLYGLGGNSEKQTTRGWPDAGVVWANGTVDAVEATRARGDWQSHIAADFVKAENDKYPNLNGFLFVAGYPKKKAAYKEIGDWKAKFHSLGIDEQRIDILVGMGLVRELAKPRYARTRLTILGISDSPLHFKMLGEHTTANERLHAFEPSAQEYASGLVYRPKLTDTVESQLRVRGCALVRGRGAAGKTVMVNLITAGPEYRSLPTYYLNMALWAEREHEIRGSMEDTLAAFGGDGILFVLDNVHRVDEWANDLFHYWKETASRAGTRLLLVGRETRTLVGSRLDEVPDLLPPLILHAGGDELRGVYRRIVLADQATQDSAPPPEAVQSWLQTFGGRARGDNPSADLIAFSAAARKRKNSLLKKDWRLTESDAIEEIRKHYLKPLGEGERRNLLRLASLPEDYSLPSPALADPIASFERCVETGIVFESEHGDARHLRYSLVHSALGRLFTIGRDTPRQMLRPFLRPYPLLLRHPARLHLALHRLRPIPRAPPLARQKPTHSRHGEKESGSAGKKVC